MRRAVGRNLELKLSAPKEEDVGAAVGVGEEEEPVAGFDDVA